MHSSPGKNRSGDDPMSSVLGQSIGRAGEDAWIEVVQKMDEVYSDLVTSQTQLENKNAQLEEAQVFIQSVLASMTDVLIVCDTKGNIQQINAALVSLTGQPEEELVGSHLSTVFALPAPEVMDLFFTAGAGNTSIRDTEVSVISPQGEPTPLAVNSAERYDRTGKFMGLVLTGRPLGELKKAYKNLDEAHRKLTLAQQKLIVTEKMAALGRLVAGVAHELNNPISFVFGNMHALKRYGQQITQFFTLLRKTNPSAEIEDLMAEQRIDKILKDITPLVEGTLEGAERVSDIVQGLRRFSSNQQETPVQFNLIRVVRTAVDWVVKAERAKPAVKLDLPEVLEIRGKKGQIHQILVNLVQNAVDALSDVPNPEIQVSCHQDGDVVEVCVSDNGHGIAAKEIDKIFEPFFTTKPIGQGTGLGLYISYGMAVEQGGSLTAANNENGGATFTLKVPVNGQ